MAQIAFNIRQHSTLLRYTGQTTRIAAQPIQVETDFCHLHKELNKCIRHSPAWKPNSSSPTHETPPPTFPLRFMKGRTPLLLSQEPAACPCPEPPIYT